jgi:hypothetical protein
METRKKYLKYLENLIKQIPVLTNLESVTIAISTIDGYTKDNINNKSTQLLENYLFTLLAENDFELYEFLYDGLEPYGGVILNVTKDNINIQEIEDEEEWFWHDKNYKNKDSVFLNPIVTKLSTNLKEYTYEPNDDMYESKMITSITEFKQYLKINERNWKNTIKLKHIITGEDLETNEQVITVVNAIVNILNTSKKRVTNSDNIYEYEEIVDNFEFLKTLHDGTISENDWIDYSYEGEATEWFNDYLEQLYDFADSNDIWIG